MLAMETTEIHLEKGQTLALGDREFTVLDLLGRGSFGKVYSVQSRIDYQVFAVKTSNLDVCCTALANMGSSISATAELEFLQIAHHPSLLRLHFAAVLSPCMHLVLDLEGPDLFTYLDKHGSPSDEACQRYAHALLHALSYMHSMDFAHRDVKIENLLLPLAGCLYQRQVSLPTLKLCDFGFVKICAPTTGCKTICGTLASMAPEVWTATVDAPYGFLVDMWSCGVVAYTLLTALPPFEDDDLRNQVLTGNFVLDESAKAAMSHFALDFVRACLVTEPARRCTARLALCLPWVGRLL